GSIFAHSKSVENTAGSRPFGVEANAIWQKISQRVWDNCHCTPKTGISLSYYNYDNRYLGHSVNVGYFLEPNFRLAKRWELSLRGTFGLSYLTNPHHPIKNPRNQSYSLPISVYLLAGIGNHIKIDDKWRVGAFLNYQHISNGGLKDPNKGINWITSSLSVLYTPNPIDIPKRERAKFEQKTPIDITLSALFTTKTAQVGDKRRHLIVGLQGEASKQIGRLSALSVALEGYHDASVARRLSDNHVEGNGWRVGALVGHQFILGKFRFSQQIGYYLYQHNPYFDAWYHRWGIVYYLRPKWSIGFNMKAHRHIANFVDFRIGHKF
ncbi:MAG: acyloxyacyl hydrolase, partial [Bacteroidetes bacterium]